MSGPKSFQSLPWEQVPRIDRWGVHIGRAGLVLVLLWIGGMKFTAYEAEGIQGFIANSPAFSWMNAVLSVGGVSALIGLSEVLIAGLLVAGVWVPVCGVAGGVLAAGMFVSTLSFMLTTPGVIEPSLGFPAISVVPGQFLVKDAVLLGVSILCAGEALERLRPNSETNDERKPVMSKTAVVIMSDTEGGEALGRVVNALTAAREFKEAGDDLKVLFTGAGTKWIGPLNQPDHKLHEAYTAVKDRVAGACGYCSGAFDVTEDVKGAGVCLLEDYGTNMSYRDLVKNGYQVLNF
jgi:uncharacterized membrane protein YkgB